MQDRLSRKKIKRQWLRFQKSYSSKIMGWLMGLMCLRTLVLLGVYSVIFFVAFYFSFLLFFVKTSIFSFTYAFWQTALWVIPIKLICMLMGGHFRVVLSYFRIPDAWHIFTSLTLALLLSLFIDAIDTQLFKASTRVLIIDYSFGVLSLFILRMGMRIVREKISSDETSFNEKNSRVKRVAIVGAGEVGASTAVELIRRRGLGLKPVIFLDKNKKKWGSSIHGIPIVGGYVDLRKYKHEYDIDSIVIAAPSASQKVVNQIIKESQVLGLMAEIVPSISELASGVVKPNRVRPIEINDLLFRDTVKLDPAPVSRLLFDKVVLVTGAGGSIGSELCKQIVAHNPKRLILVEQSEYLLFKIYESLKEDGWDSISTPIVANIMDDVRMSWIFDNYHPEVVFHAAAHKHVPMMERQPSEALKNNTLGTRKIAEISSKYNVGTFVFISTDKAINPTSVMGASKRLAEIFIQSLQEKPGNKTQYMSVRFGNVLGSSGSVIPIFKEQIEKGGPLTVTHPEVTRFFMSISEAVSLVLQASTQSKGGDIFVLEMGKPIRVPELAEQMIRLSGFEPNIDIEIKYTGLRPGEKLYEELSHKLENLVSTDCKGIMRLSAKPLAFSKINSELNCLEGMIPSANAAEIKIFLKKLIPEYTPYLE